MHNDFELEYNHKDDLADVYCEFCNFSESVTLIEALDIIEMDITDPLKNINESGQYHCPKCGEKYAIKIIINITDN